MTYDYSQDKRISTVRDGGDITFFTAYFRVPVPKS